MVLRSFPSRSAKSAVPELPASSIAPKVIAMTPSPPVETPNSSSSHVPEITKTLSPAAAISADPSRTRHASAERRRFSDSVTRSSGGWSGVGRWAGRVRATSAAAPVVAIAMAVNGARQPNPLMRRATSGEPMRRANAQEVSNTPIALARHL